MSEELSAIASDKVPILEEVAIHSGYSHEDDIVKKPQNHYSGFKTEIISKLGKPLIAIGACSFLLGLILEIVAPFIHCDTKYYQCREAHVSQIGYGLWCGLMFSGVGYFLLRIVKRITLSKIVAIMTITTSMSVFALVMIILSIAAMVKDKDYYRWEDPSDQKSWENKNDDYSWNRNRQRDYHDSYDVNVGVLIPNLFLLLLGFLTLAILITAAGLSCLATCCRYNPTYLQISLFEPVTASDIEEDRKTYMQPIVQGPPSTYYVPQVYGGGGMHPVFMMQGGNQTSPFQTYKLVPVSVGESSPSGDSVQVANET